MQSFNIGTVKPNMYSKYQYWYCFLNSCIGASLVFRLYANIQITWFFPTIVATMSLAALSVFSIWKAPSIHAVVLSISCVFSAVTVTVFGTLDFIEMNVYDTSLRLPNGYVMCLMLIQTYSYALQSGYRDTP